MKEIPHDSPPSLFYLCLHRGEPETTDPGANGAGDHLGPQQSASADLETTSVLPHPHHDVRASPLPCGHLQCLDDTTHRDNWIFVSDCGHQRFLYVARLQSWDAREPNHICHSTTVAVSAVLPRADARTRVSGNVCCCAVVGNRSGTLDDECRVSIAFAGRRPLESFRRLSALVVNHQHGANGHRPGHPAATFWSGPRGKLRRLRPNCGRRVPASATAPRWSRPMCTTSCTVRRAVLRSRQGGRAAPGDLPPAAGGADRSKTPSTSNRVRLRLDLDYTTDAAVGGQRPKTDGSSAVNEL